MLPYPAIPVVPYDWPPGAVVLTPDGAGRLTVPADSSGLAALIPLSQLPQTGGVLGVSPPYRLPGDQIAQSFALWLLIGYTHAYWWSNAGDLVDPKTEDELRTLEGQGRCWGVNVAGVQQSISLALSSSGGWSQPPEYQGARSFLVGNQYWDNNGVIDWEKFYSDWTTTHREEDTTIYYEAIWGFYQIFDISWAYCPAVQSGQQAVSVLPVLLALGVLTMPLISGALAGAGSGAGRRRQKS